MIEPGKGLISPGPVPSGESPHPAPELIRKLEQATWSNKKERRDEDDEDFLEADTDHLAQILDGNIIRASRRSRRVAITQWECSPNHSLVTAGSGSTLI
jgi:hypothetical protein